MRRDSKRATIRYPARPYAAYIHLQVTEATLALLETTKVSHNVPHAGQGVSRPPQMIMYVSALLAMNES